MKISVNWLKDYIDFSLSPQELADTLSLAGHEVEGIAYRGEKLKGIITGRIESITKHPDADKLVITQLFDGTTTHQIVTGAANISEGDIVPVSLPGAVIASGMELKASKLRGVDSFGMLCSEAELGISEEAKGIWILEPDTPIGVDFIAHANLQDAILDVSILPNRGDCMSVFGIARELSVILETPLKAPDRTFERVDKAHSFSVSVADTARCPLYMGYVIDAVNQPDTPLWMKQRLEACDVRPISVLVDITNYVMLELGQPLHAFDAACIAGEAISVRAASADERFVTLDEVERVLTTDDTVICDANGPVALAGVMGGLSSEVTDKTSRVFLESAFFDPTMTRRSANRFALRTPSAIRFEKTVDPQGVPVAAHRALHLIHTLCGGSVSATACEARDASSPRFEAKTMPLNCDDINSLLGSTFSEKDMTDTLKNLGFGVDGLTLTVPSYRAHDITEWPCLAEEIIRIKGFDSIETTLPSGGPMQDDELPILTLNKEIRSFLVGRGFNEAVTFPMVSEATEANFSDAETYAIQNPLSVEEKIMKSTMAGSLFNCLKYNVSRQNNDLKLFEIAKVFAKTDSGVSEAMMCAGLMTGKWWPGSFKADFNDLNALSFEHLNGIVADIQATLNLTLSQSTDGVSDYLHPLQSVALMAGSKKVGQLGMISPSLCQDKHLKTPLYYFEFNLTAICGLKRPQKLFKAFSKFPSTTRDISFMVPKSVPFKDIEVIINKFKPKLVTEFSLFDQFESEKIGLENQSLAIRFTYQEAEKTLSDDKVNKVHERFMSLLNENLPVTIR